MLEMYQVDEENEHTLTGQTATEGNDIGNIKERK